MLLEKSKALSSGLQLDLSLLKHELLALDPLPHVEYVIDHCLEMACGVKGFGDEDVVIGSRGCRGVQWGDRNESADDKDR